MEAFSHFNEHNNQLVIALRIHNPLGSTAIIYLRTAEQVGVSNLEYHGMGFNFATMLNTFIKSEQFNQVSWERLLHAWEFFVDASKTWHEIELFYQLCEVKLP
jgi:hypothetical protein